MPSTQARAGSTSWSSASSAFVAAILGDNIGFAIGHFGGRALALRWGKYVFLTEERLDKAEALLRPPRRHRHHVRALRRGPAPGERDHRRHHRHALAAFPHLQRHRRRPVGGDLGQPRLPRRRPHRHDLPLHQRCTRYYVLIALAVLLVGYIAWRLRRRRRRRALAVASRAGEAHETERPARPRVSGQHEPPRRHRDATPRQCDRRPRPDRNQESPGRRQAGRPGRAGRRGRGIAPTEHARPARGGSSRRRRSAQARSAAQPG